MKVVSVFCLTLCTACTIPPEPTNISRSSDIVASALVAIAECQNAYNEVLGKDLPSEVDMAHVDVFEEWFTLAFIKGDSPRLGRESSDYVSYAACSIDRNGRLQSFLYRNEDGYFDVGKRVENYDRVEAAGEKPIVDLAFKKVDREFEFFEARSIPSDW